MKLRLFLILTFAGIFLLAIISYSYFNYQKKSAATSDSTTIDAQKYERRQVIQSSKVNRFTLYTPKSSSPTLAPATQSLGVKAFAGQDLNIESNGSVKTLLSEETINQLSLQQKTSDNQTPSLMARSLFASGTQHYYYNQSINGIPVYGAEVNMHVNNNQMYALDGNVTTDPVIPEAQISEEEAQNIALKKAQEDTQNKIPLYVYQSEKMIFNEKILGISEDDINHLVLVVWIRSNEASSYVFSVKYFVDLVTGEIVYRSEEIIKSLNREIRRPSNTNYQVIRTEGQAAIADEAANQVYDIFGQVWNFFSQNFNRDSFDGNGAKIVGVVHFNDPECPNAFADTATSWIYMCDGMYADDVLAHEFTHLVTGNKLVYRNQSGAMNEGMSDIFSIGIDHNWTMAEDSVLGILRYEDDPTKSTKYTPPQPDRIFSSNYYCEPDDNGGVHVNNGILNKTFYLMSEGGNFNGCNIQPIGMDKAHKIFYRALTTYTTSTANYRDMYDYLNRACNDLYGDGSTECFWTKSVMQATEMDQQPAGLQSSPVCNGGQPQAPLCVNAQPPTGTPTNGPTSPISPSPTLGATPTPQATPTPKPTLPPLPTVAITPSGNVELNLKLKFQGVQKKPKDEINKLYVKVSLVSSTGKKETSHGVFRADDKGVWSGKVFFNLSPIETAKYNILIKGPMHLQKKVCESEPVEAKDGYYRCVTPNISIVKGANSFDFSKITLLAGDLPVQDGIVNSYDLSLVRQRLGVTVTGPQLYDLNMDGVINTQDYSLILYTLSIRFDD